MGTILIISRARTRSAMPWSASTRQHCNYKVKFYCCFDNKCEGLRGIVINGMMNEGTYWNSGKNMVLSGESVIKWVQYSVARDFWI